VWENTPKRCGSITEIVTHRCLTPVNLTSRWGLKDLHFENYDDENDHPWHELQVVEFTDEEPTEQSNMKAFLQKVADSEWW
jgi:hypothetical protein